MEQDNTRCEEYLKRIKDKNAEDPTNSSFKTLKPLKISRKDKSPQVRKMIFSRKDIKPLAEVN